MVYECYNACMKNVLSLSLFAITLTACSAAVPDQGMQEYSASSLSDQIMQSSQISISAEMQSSSSIENNSTSQSANDSEERSITSSLEQSSSASSQLVQATTFTLAEVSQHASEDSCYTVVGSNVYDITSYIPYHPGGKRDIMKICGRDGSSLFTGKHGDDQKALDQLQKMYIGKLAQ
jgi:cytochrome b involved in lipid metabolism